MRCAACGEETPDRPCARCGADPRVGGRFTLLGVLGRGATGTTWRARDADGAEVALKEVVLGREGADPKAAALAEREAEVLRQLDHPQIPRFVARLETAAGRARHLWLATGLVDGEDLRAGLADHRWSEDEVLALLADLCGPLAYLHGRSPPVVHRDLKPANVVRARDGRFWLVDFGSVRDALGGDLGGSTVAGTFGFMAPEQFAGDATPRSDLYGLGALAVALLTREDPARLQAPDRTVRWRGRAELSPGAGALLDALLAPDPADRPGSAGELAARIAALRADGGSGPGAAAREAGGSAGFGGPAAPGGGRARPGTRAAARAGGSAPVDASARAGDPLPVRERPPADGPEPFPELPAAPERPPAPARISRDLATSLVLAFLLLLGMGLVAGLRRPPHPPPPPPAHAAAAWPVLPAGALAGLEPVSCEATGGFVGACPLAFRGAAQALSAGHTGVWRWDPAGVAPEDVEAARSTLTLRPGAPAASRWEDALPLRVEGEASGPWPAVGTPVVEVRCRVDATVGVDGLVARATVSGCPEPYHARVGEVLAGRVHDAPPEPVFVRSEVVLAPPGGG